ncbi:MAG: helix-turn-helix domain-containing protein [Paludibacteraceae bacterium]|nr:helix-turn-helix domain-containing protein [Paludibacteraceae bacterium]
MLNSVCNISSARCRLIGTCNPVRFPSALGRLCLLMICQLTLCSFLPYFHDLSDQLHAGHSSVTAIDEDTCGFTWLAMGDNIVRTDGVNVRHYADKFAQQGFWLISFHSVCCTLDGNIYAASSRGLFQYVPETDNFILLYDRPIRNIYEDKHQNLWLSNGFVVFYHTRSRTATTIEDNGREIQGQLFTSPTAPFVYIITNEALLTISPPQQPLLNAQQLDKQTIHSSPHPFLHKQVRALALADSTLFVLTKSSGLWKQQDNRFTLVNQLLYDGRPVNARQLVSDNDTIIWAGTMQGLFRINLNTLACRLFRQTFEPGALVNNSVQALFLDSRHNLWVGTYAGGLCVLNQNDYNKQNNHSFADYGVVNMPISALLPANDTLWLGTEGNGLFCYVKNKGLLRRFAHSDDPSSLPSDNIKALSRQGDYLWVATYLGGLSCLNISTGKCDNTLMTNSDNRLISRQVYNIVTDSSGGLWAVYQDITNVVSCVNTAAKPYSVVNYHIPDPEGEHVSTRLYYLAVGNDCLWLATTTSLHCFSLSERTYLFSATPQTHALIQDICYDPACRCLWLATLNNGLMRFNITTHSFSTIPLPFEKGNDGIRKLCLVGNTLYLSTDGQGVFALNTLNCNMAAVADVSNIFTITPNLADSTLILGAGGQWTTVSMQRAATTDAHPAQPATFIADVAVNNQSVYLNDTTYYQKIKQLLNAHISLAHNENNLSLTLSNGAYVPSQACHFRFRLLPSRRNRRVAPADTVWRELPNTQRTVNLLQLNTGTYLFQAQASNDIIHWGNTLSLKITVKPVWWMSNAAICCYVFAGAMIVAYIIFLLISHYRLQRSLFETNIRRQAEEKASRAKVLFFTDVNKELKAPLINLKKNVSAEQAIYVQQMLDIMDSYTQRYCIDIGTNPVATMQQQQLDKLTTMISERMLDGHVDIDRLAADMGMSRRKLFSFVKDMTGKAPIEYIRSFRLQTAAKLMLEQGLTVKEAMDKVGIESQSYFVKAFRAEFGDTPGAFVTKQGNKH